MNVLDSAKTIANFPSRMTKGLMNSTIAAFWDVTPCGSCKIRRFGEMYRFHHKGEKKRELATTLAVTNNQARC
jgi:hypothetical protein